MAWSPAARAAAAAARKQKSPGGFTSRPEHQPSVTGMGNAKHGVAQPHSQAPHVLPPDNVVRQSYGAAKAMRPGGPNPLKRASDAGHRRTNAALNRKSHPDTHKLFKPGGASLSDYVQTRITRHAKAVSRYK